MLLLRYVFIFYEKNTIWFQREPLYHDVHRDTTSKRSNSKLIKRNINVDCCLFDASKTFDKVQ